MTSHSNVLVSGPAMKALSHLLQHERIVSDILKSNVIELMMKYMTHEDVKQKRNACSLLLKLSAIGILELY